MTGGVLNFPAGKARQGAAKWQNAAHDLFEAAPDIVYTVDLADGRLNLVGGPVKQMLGYTIAETTNLLEQGLQAIAHPGDGAILEAHRARTRRMEDESVATVDCRIRRADKSYIWLNCREKILNRDATGRASQMLGFAHSIQDRKKSERSNGIALAKLRRTLESVTDCYFTVDRSLRLTDINQACLDWMGVKRDEAIGTNFRDWFRMAGPCGRLTKRALEKRRPLHAEVQSALHPDRWLDYHVYPSRNGLVVFFHDITDRKLAEQNAASSRGLLLAALNALPAHIAILDQQGIIVDVNGAWHRFAESNGYVGSDHGIGQNYLEICRSVQDSEPSGARVAEQLEAILAGKAFHFSTEYACGQRWFVLHVTRFAADGMTYVVVAHEDITEFFLVRQAFTSPHGKQRHEVSQLMRQSIVNRLSSSIAHELNQPLTAIMSNAEAALDQIELDPPDIDGVRETLQDIVAEDRRAADVIGRVRSLMKRDSGKFENVSINQLVEATLTLLRNEVMRRGVDFSLNCEQSLPQIRGDFVELQQVLINVIMNALEAFGSDSSFSDGSPAGRRKIVIKTETWNNRVRLVVSDNGPGVPPALQGNLFEPFVSTKSKGLGLGLSICTTIAESHGGTITLEDNKEGGATAILSLPIAK